MLRHKHPLIAGIRALSEIKVYENRKRVALLYTGNDFDDDLILEFTFDSSYERREFTELARSLINQAKELLKLLYACSNFEHS